ncbi:MAG: NTP transferase domain-containing protein, partial [Phycisphaerae bacterium]|nr:NTP transferase domain-containing protein [Phycisphaerae bacterium]
VPKEKVKKTAMTQSLPRTDIACIILCAGRCQRMGALRVPKPCFEFDGEAAVNRCVSAFKSVGLRRFLAVVGHEAEQLMRTVSQKHPDVLFAFQSEHRGTGHAARCGYAALRAVAEPDAILISMGDKLIHGSVAAGLVARFEETEADLAFAVLPKEPGLDLGRIVIDGGRVLGDVEAKDIARARLWQEIEAVYAVKKTVVGTQAVRFKKLAEKARLPRDKAELLEAVLEGRASGAVDEIRRASRHRRQCIHLNGRSLMPDQVEALSPYVNAALYLFKRSALEVAFDHIQPRGSKGEEYLTDGLNYLASARDQDGTPKYAVEPVLLENPRFLLSYNTVPQLTQARRTFEATWS